jgi:hypothetical protein
MYIGIALVIVDVLQIPTGNAGGHLAHIGGATLGYIYAQQLQNGKDIGSGFERLWKWFVALFTAQPNMKTVHRTPRRLGGQDQMAFFIVYGGIFNRLWGVEFALPISKKYI